jgi:hypothetical protein
MNDINAACAGATNVLKNKVTTPDRTIEIRLEKLAELKRKGLINHAEYAARREKILDEVEPGGGGPTHLSGTGSVKDFV